MKTERISITECRLHITMSEIYERFRDFGDFYICSALMNATDLPISGFVEGAPVYRQSDAFYWPVTTRSFYGQWCEYMKLEADSCTEYFEYWNEGTEFDLVNFDNSIRPYGRKYRLSVLEICAERDPDYEFVIECRLEDDSEVGCFRFIGDTK